MDDVLMGSLEVLYDTGLADPRPFFIAVQEVHDDVGDAGFDEFRSAFAERAGRDGFAEAAERFTDHLADHGGADTVRKLVDEGTNTVVAEYERIAIEADVEGYEEQAWLAFLAEFGTGWNGDAQAWAEFRTWFLYHAQEHGVAAAATDFLDYAEDSADRVAVFVQYGIAIEAAAEVAEEDPEVWQAFLADYGPDWNGAEENWAAFVPHFLYYAGERGVTGFAEAFVENAPDDNATRIEYFATYGITTGASVDEDFTAKVMDQVQQDLPGLAEELGITEEDLAQELAELTPEEIAAAIAADTPSAS